jgi:hypothetical protein
VSLLLRLFILISMRLTLSEMVRNPALLVHYCKGFYELDQDSIWILPDWDS